MKFSVNIHPLERILRVAVGAGLIAYYFLGGASPWFLLGIVPLATGLSGWCPPYSLIGFSTCKKKD